MNRKKIKAKPLQPRYSGRYSCKFWKEIDNISDCSKWDAAYSLGVILQNLEEDVLREINSLRIDNR